MIFFASLSHAQGLAAFQAYCHWMAQYYLETHRQQQHQEKFVTLVSNAIDSLVPLMNKEVSSYCFVCLFVYGVFGFLSFHRATQSQKQV